MKMLYEKDKSINEIVDESTLLKWILTLSMIN